MIRRVRGTLNREGASKHLNDGAVEEVLSEHGGVDGGRHEDDADVRVGLDHVSEDDHQEVRLHTHTHMHAHTDSRTDNTGSDSTFSPEPLKNTQRDSNGRLLSVCMNSR